MIRYALTLVVATAAVVGSAQAQTPAADPSAKLREVLPPDVAERVLAKIAEARARELPAPALENRALKFAARGVPAAAIERSVNEHANRMALAKQSLEQGRGSVASSEEVEAGAEALSKGVDGAQVSELAKSAPSGRSLAVPLFVVGSLIDRGLPSDEALRRVHDNMIERKTDRELSELPNDNRLRIPAAPGRDVSATKRPNVARPAAVGQPTSVPRNPGKAAKPAQPPQSKRP